MKIIILLSIIAIACAIPLEDKVSSAPKAVPVDTVKSPVDTKSSATGTRTNQQQPQRASNTQKVSSPVTNNAQRNTPPRNSPPRPAANPIDSAKPPQTVRVSRDTNQKNVPTNKPVVQQQADNKPKNVPTQDTRKNRDGTKVTQPVTNNNNQQKTGTANAQSPQVARVPLTSTNSRNKRDTKDQTKTLSNINVNTKTETVQVPAQQARDKPVTLTRETIQVSSKDQGPSLHYPVPVDQVLRQKQTEHNDQKTVVNSQKTATEGPKAVTNAPVELKPLH